MPEHLRSLVVILLLAIPVFAFARLTIPIGNSNANFNRKCALWFALTSIIFVFYNFWMYVILGGAILFFSALRETNKVALFFYLLFSVPPISADIPAFGSIQYFFSIGPVRLLELIIFFPAFLSLAQRTDTPSFGRTLPEKIIGLYICWNIVLLFSLTTFTNALRNSFYLFTDIFLPFYVVHRSLKNSEDLRNALSGFVVSAMVLAAVGIFELFKGWLLFSSLSSATAVSAAVGGYLLREGSLRALASTGQPIVLGYVMVVALGFFFCIQKSIKGYLVKCLWMALLIGGLIAPQSRGPWVGAVVLLLLFIATGPQSGKRLVILVAGGMATVALMLVLPLGDKLISYLPFVGTVEQGNVTYRQHLIEICVDLVVKSPIVGVPNAMTAPELQSMRQGQGIIDIVNTYVAISLGTGFVGLTLFVSIFTSIGVGIFRAMRRVSGMNEELQLQGRVLLSTLIAILVMIGTVSSISVIPVIYWSVAGLGLAFIQIARSSEAVLTHRVVPSSDNVSGEAVT